MSARAAAYAREAPPRPFAKQVQKEYPLDDMNMYVMNDLKTYANLYGLNFYLGNKFHKFPGRNSR
ncbi:MAG: hypothetical protein ACLR6J_07670 [Parabacteroides merdae]